jgi:mannose-6-phosphate isomerase-like protein (cupin superfamily)
MINQNCEHERSAARLASGIPTDHERQRRSADGADAGHRDSPRASRSVGQAGLNVVLPPPGRADPRLEREDLPRRDEDVAAGACEDQGSGQACGASTDDRDVVLSHAPQGGGAWGGLPTNVAVCGTSKSTLSRLETGQRRPTLELLLALSHTYRVPLDDLVGAPPDDPRLRLKPGRVKGRTVIPLTNQAGGMQAWKIILPTRNAAPEPRAHDGHEWIYVLSGRMRFVLGEQDSVLGPGEVAAFEATVPHWFGSTGDEPAEILSIFGRPGERMAVPTTPVGDATVDKDRVGLGGEELWCVRDTRTARRLAAAGPARG